MEKKLDLRIQKTYSALTDTFISILCEKKFEEITVNEICEKALVRRATFYKHFADKYELMSFIIKQQLNLFREKSFGSDIPRFSEDYYLSIFRMILDFIDYNIPLINSLKNSNVFPVISAAITEELYLMMKEIFKEDAQNGKDFILPYDIMARAYVGIVVSIGRYWIDKNEAFSRDEMMSKFKILAKRLYG